jgi:transposase
MANTATPKTKETKADRAVAMKLENPSISNKEIAETVGMADAYVSQMLSKARDAGILPPRTTAASKAKAKATATKATVAAKTTRRKTTKRTTDTPKVVVTRAAKVSPAADTMTATAVLEARAQIACMVQRLGACNVKDIIADVIS